jgi:hypothetical protein
MRTGHFVVITFTRPRIIRLVRIEMYYDEYIIQGANCMQRSIDVRRMCSRVVDSLVCPVWCMMLLVVGIVYDIPEGWGPAI